MTFLRPVLALLLMSLVTLAFAQQTPAGTQIQNQATAEYVDSSGETQTTNSNQVITIVQQVYDVVITPDGTVAAPGQSQDATPGSTVYFPYTLTNEGNGADTFALTSDVATDETPGVGTPIFYLDNDGDGVRQPGEPEVTSVSNLPAGESVKLIMAYQIPTGATAGNTVIASPIGTSQGDATQIDDNNYHQTNVVQGAVIGATKTVDQTTANPGDTLTYTVTLRNTGSASATNVVITDILPDGVTYVSATTTPSSATLDDTGAPTITATFATIASGQVVELEIVATVDDGTEPGDLENTASVTYDELSDSTDPVETNTTTTEVLPEAGVAVGPNGDPLDGQDGDSDETVSYTTSEGYTITGADDSDTQVLAEANAGTNVSFINTVQNTGTDTDTFDITTNTPAFPDGASIVLTRIDGTPLSDTDNDGTPDSGPLAPGESFSFITRVILPSNVPAEDDDTVNAAQVEVTATSSLDSDTVDTTTNVIQNIAGPGVLIGNDNGDDGAVDPTADERTAAPGETVVFSTDIVNDGGSNDNFDLTGSVTFQDAAGNDIVVPVIYYPDLNNDGSLDADDIAAGPITNTGTVEPAKKRASLQLSRFPLKLRPLLTHHPSRRASPHPSQA